MAGSCGVISAPNSPPACRLTHVPAPGGSSLERARWRHLVQRWHDIWGGAPGRHRPSTATACGTFKRSCISTTSSVPAPLWREAEETRWRCSLGWGGESHSGPRYYTAMAHIVMVVLIPHSSTTQPASRGSSSVNCRNPTNTGRPSTDFDR